jgi:UDP-N-acetylglucosamine--N-acetylmuramyl-(pentapeptide) pyrophosphoryl-undecaprenol N-acetylglucosamine transferase
MMGAQTCPGTISLNETHGAFKTGKETVNAAIGASVSSASRPVLIMAGGTGGHVFPALAVAKVLRDRGVSVVWLGVPGSMESRLVPANGFPIEWVRVAGVRGKGLKTWLLAPLRIIKAVAQAMGVLRRVQPRSVLGLGGYVSGPGGIAAWLLRVPLLIHEQNAIAGMTNRWLARLATQVLEAFPGSFKPRVHARTIGNPVRADIAALPAPQVRFAGRETRSRLLVFGGSQGAQRLNSVVPQALSKVAAENRPQIRHQTGERGLEAARAAYAAARVEAEVLPFIDDMAAAYAWADLAVCRAGAMTIAELQAAGVGAIFVPLPVATDDHQTKNAEAMVRNGAARLIQERDLTPERLGAAISELISDRAQLLKMAEAARGSRVIDAAAQLADLCIAAGAHA